MKCQQQLSVRSSAGVLEAPSGYALRCLQDIKAKRTVYLLQNRTILFATNTIGVDSQQLDYRRVAEKLLLDRELVGIRYYVGKVSGDLQRIRGQQKLFSELRSQQVHISLGRIEKIEIAPDRNPLVTKLKKVLERSGAQIPTEIHGELTKLCREKIPTYTEKQVDVRIAVDLVSMAQRDEYDVAYLLSADGDFVPAVEEVKRLEKQVFAASASPGQRLSDAVNTFIRLRPDWFVDCWRR